MPYRVYPGGQAEYYPTEVTIVGGPAPASVPPVVGTAYPYAGAGAAPNLGRLALIGGGLLVAYYVAERFDLFGWIGAFLHGPLFVANAQQAYWDLAHLSATYFLATDRGDRALANYAHQLAVQIRRQYPNVGPPNGFNREQLIALGLLSQ